MSNIRNFCIIAHIDHGKSTLADRLMELTNAIDKRHQQDQALDSHPISRERGITIRLAPVTMKYKNYILNLIDTPGHVDFSYEVERSLAACEGAILLVDATQGIQAQTLSHLEKAIKLNLKIIPVINKIDSPSVNINSVISELAQLVQLDPSQIFKISAKTGQGVPELLDAIITQIPQPKINLSAPTRALVFSSQYDSARGVTAYVRIFDGSIKTTDKLVFLATNATASPFEIGHFTPNMTKSDTLNSGEVGYIITNLRDPDKVKVGDTIVLTNYPANPLTGFHDPVPVVFTSIFPVDQNDYATLTDSLKKLRLNDSAITFQPTSSKALGRGFRCGFLGHLHAEISQERLEQDFNLAIISTTPTVEYKNNEEPWVKANIIVPQDFVGPIITLCEDRRGKLINMDYHGNHVTLIYDLPLSEIITDFFDQMKSLSSGFASIDYEVTGYRPFDSVNLDILINHEAIDAFSLTLEKSRAEKYGKFIVEKLKSAIPRQQIPIPIQASINGQVIARETIPSFRKDVTAKLYGGDSTRRMKLLEKQKKGKEKMKQIGKVTIPSDTFLKIFRT